MVKRVINKWSGQVGFWKVPSTNGVARWVSEKGHQQMEWSGKLVRSLLGEEEGLQRTHYQENCWLPNKTPTLICTDTFPYIAVLCSCSTTSRLTTSDCMAWIHQQEPRHLSALAWSATLPRGTQGKAWQVCLCACLCVCLGVWQVRVCLRVSLITV